MAAGRTYFKSLATVGSSLATETYDPHNRQRHICQTVEDLLGKGVMLPNTVHNELSPRLCVSLPTTNYNDSYRPEGLLFAIDKNPDYCSPIDLMALTDGKSLTSSDYNSKFVPGAKELIFDSVDKMLAAYPAQEEALLKLNSLRRRCGLEEFTSLPLYNECCFEEAVNISPVALVGRSDVTLKTAEDFSLPNYSTLQNYVQNTGGDNGNDENLSFSDFLQKSSVGALYRVGASFTMDAVVLGLLSGDLQGFMQDLDPAKLLRIAAYVVAINFVDYRFDVTNKLYDLSKKLSQ